jgi:diadenosine tetraphosphate (Ap4A) HIT family hydrolase
MVPTCPYCSGFSEDAWILTDFVVALPHPAPVATCHITVAPRRHVAAFYDLDVEEQQILWHAVEQLRERIMASIKVESFAIGFVDAAPAAPGGIAPAHAYIHLIPRIPGETIDLPAGAEWVELGLPDAPQ